MSDPNIGLSVGGHGGNDHEDHSHGDEGEHVHDVEVVISVNEQPVKLRGQTVTGSTIKAAAIAQGVQIEPNFVLQEELPNGTSQIIGDNDPVHLRRHLRFTAIRPDDNS